MESPARKATGAVLVGLGANLPGATGAAPVETCARALEAMPAFGIEVVARSRWFSSAAVAETVQPDFVNGVARVATDLPPEGLLAALHRIEDLLGRRRPYPGAPRVIDLDLLAYGAALRDPGGGAAGPVLPHPRLHERAFVLLPLTDVAPGWRHPATGSPLAALVAALPSGQRCAPLE